MSSSSLSFIASFVLACNIPKKANGGLTSPYRRIIFGLSIADVIKSLAILTGPFLVPGEDFPKIIWAVGNQDTCALNGVMLTLGVGGAPMYTCVLCFYFYCKVSRNMSDQMFRDQHEKKLHVSIILWNVTAAIVGWASYCMNPVPGGDFCFIHPSIDYCDNFVEYCDGSEPSRPPRSPKAIYVALVTSFIPALLAILIAMGYLILLSRTVVTQEKKNNAHRFRVSAISAHPNSLPSSRGSARSLSTASGRRFSLQRMGEHRRSSFFRSHSDFSEEYITRGERMSRKRTRGVIIQACLFIAVLFVTYFFVYMFGIYEITNSSFPYVLSIILHVFFPLGGALNILVYTRQKVAEVRRSDPKIYWCIALWKVMKAGGDTPAEFRRTRASRRCASMVSDTPRLNTYRRRFSYTHTDIYVRNDLVNEIPINTQIEEPPQSIKNDGQDLNLKSTEASDGTTTVSLTQPEPSNTNKHNVMDLQSDSSNEKMLENIDEIGGNFSNAESYSDDSKGNYRDLIDGRISDPDSSDIIFDERISDSDSSGIIFDERVSDDLSNCTYEKNSDDLRKQDAV